MTLCMRHNYLCLDNRVALDGPPGPSYAISKEVTKCKNLDNFGTLCADSKHIGNSTSDMLLITHLYILNSWTYKHCYKPVILYQNRVIRILSLTVLIGLQQDRLKACGALLWVTWNCISQFCYNNSVFLKTVGPFLPKGPVLSALPLCIYNGLLYIIWCYIWPLHSKQLFREDNNTMNGSMETKQRKADRKKGERHRPLHKYLVQWHQQDSGGGQVSISHRHLGSDVLERIMYGIMQERHKRSMNMTTTEFKPSNVDQPLRGFMNNGDRCTCVYCTVFNERARQ